MEWCYELLRLKFGARYFEVTQIVDGELIDPDEAVKQLRDPVDGETVLVRYRPGGGVTPYRVTFGAPTFEQISF